MGIKTVVFCSDLSLTKNSYLESTQLRKLSREELEVAEAAAAAPNGTATQQQQQQQQQQNHNETSALIETAPAAKDADDGAVFRL